MGFNCRLHYGQNNRTAITNLIRLIIPLFTSFIVQLAKKNAFSMWCAMQSEPLRAKLSFCIEVLSRKLQIASSN